MAKERRFLITGTKPNERTRKIGAMLLWLGPFVATFVVTVGMAFNAPFLGLIALQPLVSISVGIWVLQSFGDITVLDDGLDVGGRFVPFSAVNDVGSPPAKLAEVSYTYHGAKMKTIIGVGRAGKANLPALLAELRMLAGLPQDASGEVAPSTTQG